MAEIKPDKILADLEKKLAAAKTDAERAAIQEEITARQAEIATATGVGVGVGFGAGGMYIPSNAAKGTTILEPTYEPGVFTKTEITGNPRDPYGRAEFGNKVTLYDAEGKPLSAADAAKTEVGLNFAASGRDIGYGPGFIAPGVRPDIEFATFNNVRADMPNAAAAAGVVGGPAGFRTSSSSTTASTTASFTAATTATAEQRSAYGLLRQQFALYGLESLVPSLETLIAEGVSPSEFTLRIRESEPYKKRFAANEQRIKAGLRALSEAEYVALEDQYQNVMRNYGLPASYYTKGDMGAQQGFEKFIAGDVSAAELEDRIQTAQNRVINAAPEVATSLREFYPEITGGDILAYALDPDKALTEIRRKVGAAEIGAGARQAGLSTGLARAEELQRYGVTAEQARQGFQTIGSLLPRASQLGDIYAKQGMGPFTQTTAEAEVFGTPGAVEAAAKRRKLTELETAQFSGTSGATGGALGRERAGQF